MEQSRESSVTMSASGQPAALWLPAEMAVFARVVQLGSFTAAASSLGCPKVAVSRAVASLERSLGIRLLERTTRRLGLTTAGRLLLPHCTHVLEEAQAVRAGFMVSGRAGERLRVVADRGYGRLLVNPLVPRFLERYPHLALEVGVLEQPALEPSADWDLIVCNAPVVTGAALTSVELGSPPLILCASAGYLKRHGRPREPADLLSHVVLKAGMADEARLRLSRDGKSRELRWRPRLQVEDPALVHASAAAGLGIAVLPEFLCHQGLAAGKLDRVLDGWTLEDRLQLRALYASERAGRAPIHQFLQFLMANLVPVLGEATAQALPV